MLPHVAQASTAWLAACEASGRSKRCHAISTGTPPTSCTAGHRPELGAGERLAGRCVHLGGGRNGGHRRLVTA